MSVLCRRQQNEHGFTLIELMATLGILALIALIAVPAIGSIIGDSESQSDAAAVHMVEEAARTAKMSGLAHDRENGYTIPALIDAGYLDVPSGSKVNNPSARVEKIGYTYQYFSEHGIGGRNLLPNSNNFLNFTPYRGAGNQTTREVINDGDLTVEEWGAHDATRLRFTSKNGTLLTTPQLPSDYSAEVTYSYWIKNMGDESFLVRYNGYAGASAHRLEPGQSEYVSVSGKMRDNYVWFQHQLVADNPNGSVIDVALWRSQLEYGDTATPWRPAPEDALKD